MDVYDVLSLRVDRQRDRNGVRSVRSNEAIERLGIDVVVRPGSEVRQRVTGSDVFDGVSRWRLRVGDVFDPYRRPFVVDERSLEGETALVENWVKNVRLTVQENREAMSASVMMPTVSPASVIMTAL